MPQEEGVWREGRKAVSWEGGPSLDTSVHPSFLCYHQLITPNYTYLQGNNTEKAGGWGWG